MRFNLQVQQALSAADDSLSARRSTQDSGFWTRLGACAFALLLPMSAGAGELVIHNTSPAPITCHADGYTKETGWPVTQDIAVEPRSEVRLAPSYKRSLRIIEWVECQGLQTRMMHITPDGQDGLVEINGRQKRVLNAALYPYIPSDPNGNFANLLAHVIERYQAANPDVLLNAVMTEAVNTYSFTELPKLLGSGGYDVIELDTLFLGFLASSGLITPAAIAGDAPWPAALAGSTYDGTLYGVPSWLCMDFLYSFAPELGSVHSRQDLLAFLAKMPPERPELTGSFSGLWWLPSIYINAYAQTHGYADLPNAMAMPPDPAVIADIASVAGTCQFDAANNCVDGAYRAYPTGTLERNFAAGGSSSDVGFSELSFYIALSRTGLGKLTLIPVPWGTKPEPLLYSDTFVTSKANCADSACAHDSVAFTSLMTGAAMKTYIAFSGDLGHGAPPRHLLVATQAFWGQKKVHSDPIYRQVAALVQIGHAFPNAFTAEQAASMESALCSALKQHLASEACGKTE